MSLPQGREKLYWLIELVTNGHHDLGTFCKEFERAFNFEIERSELSAKEETAFKALCDKVVLYCPFPEELKTIPIYLSGDEIRAAIDETRNILNSR